MAQLRHAQSLNLGIVNYAGRRFLNILGFLRQGSSALSSQSNELGKESDAEHASNTKELILKSALQFVPLHGWSREAVAAGAVKIGLPATLHGLFEHSGSELVHYFISTSNNAVTEKLKAEVQQSESQTNKLKTNDIIRDAIQARLRMVAPYINTWPQAMGLMALPQNATKALKSLGILVDDIWYYAGDRSVDFNWYTKRVGLVLVYNSTEVHMIQDKSHEFEETWAFLDRRLDNFSQFGQRAALFRDGRKQAGEISFALSKIMLNALEINTRR